MASLANTNFDADINAAKRGAPRLPLSLPGTFISTQGNHSCILVNLSRTGVLIAINEPLKPGNDGFLRCGPIDHFVTVQRRANGLNAMTFEIPVTDAYVAQVRKYQESFAERELSELRDQAREWAGA
ncbi:PilZ domain-containing protein [Erythrobacter sp. SCSIO 43205]|uniref:PilZ domain-containing protein n=1 Tax=Erythrobacter sp. SCSIO 43205 TaxID=2779361 RepID=UPI001CA9018D|nr:PilZ domain-containing protein [Erythrobacter sp. SCSIO 43205]UAB77900.1 PilZ domain-containing protein [Erythrobacter sp. SCSIO 43205]